MTPIEDLTKEELLEAIADARSKLKATDDSAYRVSMDRKFLRHRLADLLYELKKRDDICD